MLHSGLSVDRAACTASSVPLASCTGLQGAEWRAFFSVLFSVKGSAVKNRYSVTKCKTNSGSQPCLFMYLLYCAFIDGTAGDKTRNRQREEGWLATRVPDVQKQSSKSEIYLLFCHFPCFKTSVNTWFWKKDTYLNIHLNNFYMQRKQSHNSNLHL